MFKYLNLASFLPGPVLLLATTTSQPKDPNSQWLELAYAILGLVSTFVLPLVVQRIRKLTKELQSHRSAAATAEDFASVRAEIEVLKAKVIGLQNTIDVTTEERDSLLKELKEKDQAFQATIMDMTVRHATETQKLYQQLDDERQLNSALSRQYDELAQLYKELKQEVATMRGVNEFAEQIMAGITGLANMQKGTQS